MNAITKCNKYKVAVSLSPVQENSARFIGWTYYPDKINIPIMILAGTINDSINLEQLELLYSHINSDKIMARRINTTHPEMLYSSDGYVTSFFINIYKTMKKLVSFLKEKMQSY